MAQRGAPAYKWTQEIEDEIFRRIAHGESLVTICKDDWLPSRETIHKRIRNDAEFADKYARSKEDQADYIFDEILAIADDRSDDWIETENGPKLNVEHVQRSRLRIDARKWMAGKLRPKVYGEKIDHTIGNPDGTPIQFQTIIEPKPEK